MNIDFQRRSCDSINWTLGGGGHTIYTYTSYDIQCTFRFVSVYSGRLLSCALCLLCLGRQPIH